MVIYLYPCTIEDGVNPLSTEPLHLCTHIGAEWRSG